jgi:hypothetical protein
MSHTFPLLFHDNPIYHVMLEMFNLICIPMAK